MAELRLLEGVTPQQVEEALNISQFKEEAKRQAAVEVVLRGVFDQATLMKAGLNSRQATAVSRALKKANLTALEGEQPVDLLAVVETFESQPAKEELQEVAPEPTASSEVSSEPHPCKNHKKCGNMAEGKYAFCQSCHAEWARGEVEDQDRLTRPLRADVGERLGKATKFYSNYYKSQDPMRWPAEVGAPYLEAQHALSEGDRNAKEAFASKDTDNPNPGLFQVARYHYFLVTNHLAEAQFHSAARSLEGVMKGVPPRARGEVEKERQKAQKLFEGVQALEGRKRTQQLKEAAWLMNGALKAARELADKIEESRKAREGELMSKPAEDFYGSTS